MADSYIKYTGDGSTTDYTFPFPYISQGDVRVYEDGVETSAFSFLNTNEIRFTTAPTNGAKIRIERDSLQSGRKVNYTRGSLTEADLDTDSLQGFYSAQESNDTAEEAMIKDVGTEQWDAESLRLTNVADPVNDQDAVTKAWFNVNTASSTVVQAEAARDAAQAAQAAAETAYDNFDDRYLGAKATDPSTDNDGNSLLTGALYWNTGSNLMRVYNGSAWEDAVPAGSLLAANNLSDVANAATALSNLGGEPSNANLLKANSTDNLEVGFTTDLYAIPDATTTATYTVDLTVESFQTVNINGTWTLNPPASGNGFAIILATNVGTNSVTFSASFDKQIGVYDNANGKVHTFKVTKIGSYNILEITEIA